jgi:hypothetical protein
VDDPEYEVGDVRSHPLPAGVSDRIQPAPPGSLLSRRWRLALGSVLIALVVLVSAWLPLHSSTSKASFPSYLPTPTAVLTPTPLPRTSTLAAPPGNCPSALPLSTVAVPALDGLLGSSVQLTGHAPVWIVSSLYPLPSVVTVPEATPPSATNPEWPAISIFWVTGPNAFPPVTVQVHDLHNGTVAWWGTPGTNRPQVPILQLTPSGEPVYGYDLTERWLLFITRAGCYKMEVTWPGGRWSLIFAAGSLSS